MLELSFNSLLYLFFRLAPFILVCFFVLGSIINNEAKGFIYLVGLIFTAVLCYGIINMVGDDPTDTPSPACSTLKIQGIYSDKTPISMVVFSYSFFYLVYPIAKYHLELNNIPTLIFFPLLILGDIYWNTMYECFTPLNIFLALIVAGGMGVGWSAIVATSKLKGLQYFNVGSNRERCALATKGKYKCVTYDREGNKVSLITKGGTDVHTHTKNSGELPPGIDSIGATHAHENPQQTHTDAPNKEAAVQHTHKANSDHLPDGLKETGVTHRHGSSYKDDHDHRGTNYSSDTEHDHEGKTETHTHKKSSQ